MCGSRSSPGLGIESAFASSGTASALTFPFLPGFAAFPLVSVFTSAVVAGAASGVCCAAAGVESVVLDVCAVGVALGDWAAGAWAVGDAGGICVTVGAFAPVGVLVGLGCCAKTRVAERPAKARISGTRMAYSRRPEALPPRHSTLRIL